MVIGSMQFLEGMALMDRIVDASPDAPVRLPGGDLRPDRMPGHWLLARLGKRVLRPGGLALTRTLLDDLAVAPDDAVVELAPGLGVTARLVLARNPRSYAGVERDQDAASWTAGRLPASAKARIVVGSADATGLPDGAASVVLGEAMLSMQPEAHKRRIADEAYRLLRAGGRYGIHELAIVPDDAAVAVKSEIEATLSAAIHVGARPLTPAEWRALMEAAGFAVERVRFAPMRLLEPGRVIADEGLWRALRFLRNVLSDAEARRRVRTMREVFQRHRDHLRAIALVARK
jgi:hypothetical protein